MRRPADTDDRWRVPRPLTSALLAVLAALAAAFGGAGAAAAAPSDPTDIDSRLVPVPAGCTAPEPADVVFVGTAVGKDHRDQFVRYQIDQVRAGSTRQWAVGGLIDIRYGADYRFVDEGEQYLVGAGFDAEYGRLSSTVRPPSPLFGGNDVIGLEDASVECPVFEDPVRTLLVDGSSVDSGVLSLLFDDRRLLASTLLVPAAIAFAVLIVLVLVRWLWSLSMKGVMELGRTAVTPAPDHRAVRIRHHRGPGET
ncbi:MAG: hypothetical protein QNM02_15395 [Acidimicrobiia bacterium]|nr:hypothetical protein [Acidimicrobiia bacterium]